MTHAVTTMSADIQCTRLASYISHTKTHLKHIVAGEILQTIHRILTLSANTRLWNNNRADGGPGLNQSCGNVSSVGVNCSLHYRISHVTVAHVPML